MPIPFREDEDVDHLGLAAFLRIVPSGDRDGFPGALFLVNARGEPGEFTYNRLDVVQRFLWRTDDLRRHVTRRLATSLFTACPRVPSVILVLADEYLRSSSPRTCWSRFPPSALQSSRPLLGSRQRKHEMSWKGTSRSRSSGMARPPTARTSRIRRAAACRRGPPPRAVRPRRDRLARGLWSYWS